MTCRSGRRLRHLGRRELAIGSPLAADPSTIRRWHRRGRRSATARCQPGRVRVVRFGVGRFHAPDPFGARRRRRADCSAALSPHRQSDRGRRARADHRAVVRHESDHRPRRSDEPSRRRPRAGLFAIGRSIGFWFWELSHLPPRIVANVAMVDEVWAASGFIADTFREVTDKPVHVVHVPVPNPSRPTGHVPELGLPDDRFAFLVTLDHLSITDRKNPLGAIHAFVRPSRPRRRRSRAVGQDPQRPPAMVRARAAPAGGGEAPRHHGDRSAVSAGPTRWR